MWVAFRISTLSTVAIDMCAQRPVRVVPAVLSAVSSRLLMPPVVSVFSGCRGAYCAKCAAEAGVRVQRLMCPIRCGCLTQPTVSPHFLCGLLDVNKDDITEKCVHPGCTFGAVCCIEVTRSDSGVLDYRVTEASRDEAREKVAEHASACVHSPAVEPRDLFCPTFHSLSEEGCTRRQQILHVRHCTVCAIGGGRHMTPSELAASAFAPPVRVVPPARDWISPPPALIPAPSAAEQYEGISAMARRINANAGRTLDWISGVARRPTPNWGRSDRDSVPVSADPEPDSVVYAPHPARDGAVTPDIRLVTDDDDSMEMGQRWYDEGGEIARTDPPAPQPLY